MKKQLKITFAMFACALLTFVFAGVYATEPSTDTEVTAAIREVTSEEELLTALADSSVQIISLTKDITTTAKVNITRDVIIEGNSHTITIDIEDNTVWGGHYVLQVYRSTVILNNISLTGGNAALLINGGVVTVEGVLDVSGNGFGGIELAKSGDNMPSLDLTNATLKNTSEAYKLPTIWEDPSLEDPVVTENEEQYLATIEVEAANGNNQWQYYIEPSNSSNTPENQLKEQIEAGETDIMIDVFNPDATISKEVLNQLKGTDVTVTIYSYDYLIEFDAKNMTEEFTKDLSLKIDVTDEQPFESDVLKDAKSDFVFIDLEYSGVLPKGTKITIRADEFGYAEGDKLMLYYYNETTDAMELIAKEVVVDEYDLATIEINHASTYVLSTAELPVSTGTTSGTNNTATSNPNTSDMTMIVALTLGVFAVAGFGYVAKVKMSNK